MATENQASKLPYHAPTLTEHGTIRSVTNTLTTRGPNDLDGPGSYTS